MSHPSDMCSVCINSAWPESLEQQLADTTWQDHADYWKKQAAEAEQQLEESQAREAKLREIIDRMDYREGNKVPYGDTTALKEYARAERKAALLEAANEMDEWEIWSRDICVDGIRRMAEEVGN